jgi:hypothetical protein
MKRGQQCLFSIFQNQQVDNQGVHGEYITYGKGC